MIDHLLLILFGMIGQAYYLFKKCEFHFRVGKEISQNNCLRRRSLVLSD